MTFFTLHPQYFVRLSMLFLTSLFPGTEDRALSPHMRRTSYLFDRSHLRICSTIRISEIPVRAGYVSLLTAYRDTAAPYMHVNQFFPFCGAVYAPFAHTRFNHFHTCHSHRQVRYQGCHPRPTNDFKLWRHAASNVQRLSTSATRSAATPACSRAASRARMLGSPLPAPSGSSTSSSEEA
jgi:hypothetical protein